MAGRVVPFSFVCIVAFVTRMRKEGFRYDCGQRGSGKWFPSEIIGNILPYLLRITSFLLEYHGDLPSKTPRTGIV